MSLLSYQHPIYRDSDFDIPLINALGESDTAIMQELVLVTFQKVTRESKVKKPCGGVLVRLRLADAFKETKTEDSALPIVLKYLKNHLNHAI